MPLRRWLDLSTALPGAPGTRAIEVNRDQWLLVARDVDASNGRLLSLWVTGIEPAGLTFVVCAAYLVSHGLFVVALPGRSDDPYPGLQDIFPASSRMQRAAFDLSGVRSTDPDQRPWLRHAAWPATLHPLRANAASGNAAATVDDYPFLRVEGEGVHEIPVGPVHAGIIEPGHFRFSVVGEKVLRLEQRLGYVHKGIERRFTELPILEGHRLAARISGDSAVAFSWAYCQALEGMTNCAVPVRANWLRALFLELERIANHLGDLGALGNDAGFALGLAHFSRLKETLLRAIDGAFGARYLFDVIVPGGVSRGFGPGSADALAACVANIAGEAARLRVIYDEHSGIRDRFAGAGRIAPELAARLGLLGLAGRASGQAWDARVDSPCAPYDDLAVDRVVREEGDVAARVAVRFDEAQESCRLVRQILGAIPEGPAHISATAPAAGSFGLGLIEGWRGPVLVALEAGSEGAIVRCHPHDTSWQNWPLLEHAVLDNIVPDFPLINKSFNLSYSGHDL